MKFFESLRSSCKDAQFSSRYLGRDLHTVTGRNLELIREPTTLNPWIAKSKYVKTDVQCEELIQVLPEDKWRLRYLPTLLNQRREFHIMVMEEDDESTNELIRSLVVI